MRLLVFIFYYISGANFSDGPVFDCLTPEERELALVSSLMTVRGKGNKGILVCVLKVGEKYFKSR